MSQSIDERIVEMRFDNKQFESGVKESLSTLDNLKSALNLEGSAKGFAEIDKAANSVSLEGISAGIEALQKRFSTLGIVGMRVIQNITDSLMNMASSALNYVTSTIISGGWQRAMNIENAHFQLQALLKDEASVQAVMDDAMASVDGTAYAYDEAAKAASQFAASGLKAGEDMQKALRGITGVAAMTNSEYEGIARIFNTVAGNGRLMGDQLRQLSSRGMNAAATIADYLREVQGFADITEAEVRAMVSDSAISFDIFASAMDWAFGESAFRANETFTGSLANMGAALKKIGAEFFSPLIEQNSDLVLLINTLRVRINDVKKELAFDAQKSAISGLTKVTGLGTEAFEELFDTIKENGSVSIKNLNELSSAGVDATKSLTDYINGVTDGSVRSNYAIKTALDELTGGLQVGEEEVRKFVEDGQIDLKTFTNAMERSFGDQRKYSKQFSDSVLDMAKSLSEYISSIDLNGPLQILFNGVESIKNLVTGLYSILKPLGAALRETFTFSVSDIIELSNKILDLTSHMKLSEEGSKNLHDAFKGIFDLLKLLSDGFVFLIKAILPIEGPVVSLGNGLLSLAGSIGRTLTTFTEWVRNSTTIMNSYTSISNIIKEVISTIDNLISKFIEFIKGTKSVSLEVKTIPNIFSEFKNIFTSLGDSFDNAKSKVISLKEVLNKFDGSIDVIGPIAEKITSILDLLGINFDNIELKIISFNDIIKKSAEIVKKVGTSISSIISSIFKAIGEDVFGAIKIFIQLNKAINLYNIRLILKEFTGIFTSLKNTVGSIGGTFRNVSLVLKDVHKVLKAYQDDIRANVLKTIAISIGILAAALYVIAGIDSDKLVSSLGAVTALMAELFGMLVGIDKIVGTSTTSFLAIGAGLIELSLAISILAGALKKIATIDSDKLISSLGGITVLIAETTIVAIALSKFGGKITTGVTGIIAFAAAIYILSSSVKKLGELDVITLIKGLTSVFVLLVELSAFMFTMNFTDFKPSQAIAIIGLASALLILQNAVKSFGGLDIPTLAKGLSTIGLVLTEIFAFTRLSNQSKHLMSTATSLTIMATALIMLEKPMSKFGEMSWESIGKGLVGIGVALAEVVIAMRLMPKDSIMVASGLITVAQALIIISKALNNLGSMTWEEVAKGLVSLAGGLTVLTVAMNLMKGTLEASAAMLVMSVSLAAFVPSLKTLGNMSWESIGKGLVSLAGAFTIIGVAGLVLKPIIPTILSLSVALLGVGAACTMTATGILIASTALTALAASGTATAIALVELIKTLIVGIADAIVSSSEVIGNAIKTLILISCDILLTCTPKIIETIWEIIKASITSMADNIPLIISELIRLIIGVMDALMAEIPTIVTLVIDMFMGIFKGFIDALNGLDSDSLINGIESIKLITELMAIIGGLSLLAAEAVIGILAAGVVVVELIALLAIIGGIAQIPGLQWLIGEGSLFLQNVGAAIGGFIGGIVSGFSGFGAGLTSQLPKIGENLSNFMINIEPFLDGASKIDSKLMEGVGSLAKTILLLTAADILDGLTSWLTGGNSLSSFGEELATFGPYFSDFAEEVKDINPDVITGTANAALALAEMADKLPNSGGLAAKIFGDNTLSAFGEELLNFAPSIAEYADLVKDINPDAVEASVNAAKMLSDMADKLPNSGGLAAKIFGDNTLSAFGEELIPFGTAMTEYSNIVGGKIDQDAVEASVNAAKVLSDFNNQLPDTGGLAQKIFGEQKTLSQFAEELVPFGSAMAEYSSTVSGAIDGAAITASANAAQVLADLGSSLTGKSGLFSIFSHDTDLSDFAEQIKKFGKGLASYAESVSGVDAGKLDTVIVEVQKLVDIANATISLDTSGMTGFAKALKEMGKNGIDDFISGFTDSVDRVISAIDNMMNSATAQLVVDTTSFGETAKQSGEIIVTQLQIGIQSKESLVLSTVKDLCTALLAQIEKVLPKSTFNKKGQEIVTNLGTGVTSKKSSLLSTIKTLCSAIVSQFESSLSAKTFKKIGQEMVDAVGDGAREREALLLTTVKNLCNSIVSQFEKTLDSRTFRRIGEAIVEALTNGIDSKKSMATSAATQLGNSVIEAVRQTMSSSAFFKIGENAIEGLASGIESKMDRVVKAAKEAVQEAIEAAEREAEKASSSSSSSGEKIIETEEEMQAKNDAARAAADAINESKRSVKNQSSDSTASTIAYTFGQSIPIAIANGIVDEVSTVSDAVTTMSDEMTSELNSVISALSLAIEEDSTFEPVITPVVDMSNVDEMMEDINTMFNQLTIPSVYDKALETSSSFTQRSSSTNGETEEDTSTTTTVYNMTQNNYSPEPLSRFEIYRQTKNLFSQLEGAVEKA